MLSVSPISSDFLPSSGAPGVRMNQVQENIGIMVLNIHTGHQWAGANHLCP